MSAEKWTDNLDIFLEYGQVHLAAYHLGYEQGTVMDYHRRKGKIRALAEEQSLEHYHILCDKMKGSGYNHYEISNFALPGFISRHNSGYWSGGKYLGIGPSAHSYNGRSRRWNMARNASYIRLINLGKKACEEETLDERTRFHDYLMTSLRTMWGIDMEFIKNEWGKKYLEHIRRRSKPFIRGGRILEMDGKLVLSTDGMFIADHIISEMFI
jgi:oxygen-independent coproporphyrinogen-3 oxidase